MAATGAGSTGAAARTGPVSPAAGGEGTSAASRRGGWTAAGGWRLFGSPLCGAEGCGARGACWEM